MTVTSVRRTGSANVIFRGATAYFRTTFYDPFGQISIPTGAFVNVAYTTVNGQPAQQLLTMTQPAAGSNEWTAEWDSRNAFGQSTVYFSIHTQGDPPIGVEDGQFTLSANAANLPNFSD